MNPPKINLSHSLCDQLEHSASTHYQSSAKGKSIESQKSH